MIPDFDSDGFLPPGEHVATWDEIVARFDATDRRRWLLEGLRCALNALKAAGCKTIYLDGSFVTAKPRPNDYDGAWDVRGVVAARLDPILLDFNDGRRRQKQKYRGEFFPAQMPEGASGKLFMEFFQTRKDNGAPKGIIKINLDSLP